MEALIYFPLALPQKNAIAKRYVHIWVELEAANVNVIIAESKSAQKTG